jgi:hypothetical protein
VLSIKDSQGNHLDVDEHIESSSVVQLRTSRPSRPSCVACPSALDVTRPRYHMYEEQASGNGLLGP